MRALAFWGYAGAIALLPATAMVTADSAVAQSSLGSSMTTGVAPAPAARGWGNVPNAPLRPPMARPGGWGPGGWQGGNPGGPRPGGPAGPGGMPRPDGPGMHPPGGPGMPHPGGPGMMQGGHGGMRGGWSGQYSRGQYPHMGRGQVLPRRWLAPNLFVQDWWSYGLAQPGYGQNWLRYYDDALLVDDYGRVLDSRDDMDWDRGGPPPRGDDYDDYEDRDWGDGHHGHHRPGGPVVVHHGGWGGTTVVVVQSAPTVTTTTTTYYDEVIVHRGGKKVWRHRPHSKLRCRCK